MSKRILIVEDETRVVQLIRGYLEQAGFQVGSASTGPDALIQFDVYRPALLILDLMLPGFDGLEVARRIRKKSDVPIIMLTARTEEMDRIIGLESGADDYVSKPFSPRELGSGIPIKVNEHVVGILLPIAPLPPPGAPAPDRVFLSAVNGALWTAGILVAGIGFIIALILIRQITLPLRALDAATRQITQGKLHERVPVRNSDELGRLATSFNEMVENLEKAEQTKRNMIADIAHELRTPLSVIRSELEGYMDNVLEPNAENIAALHNQVLLVTRLVSDLQQLALADAGQLSIHRDVCDLHPLIEDIQTTIDAQLEEQNVQLVMDVPKELPQVLADRQRIEQVLLNLLNNATRYTPAGGTITIQAQIPDEKYIQLSVCDTGPGLSEEDLAHAFDRFYRADKSRARVSGGSGLGLAIAKAIIEAHGGHIWAENASPTGACFHFTLERMMSDIGALALRRT